MKKVLKLLVVIVLLISVFPWNTVNCAGDSLANGTYFISQGNKCVNVYANYVSGISNNTKINMWEPTKHETQQFTLEKQNDGTYKILTQKAGYTFNISSLKSGATVLCYKDTKKNTEYFIIEAVAGGYAIKPKNASALAVTVSGSNLVLKKYTGSSNQIFTFTNIKTSAPKDDNNKATSNESGQNVGDIQSPVESRKITSPFQPYYRQDFSGGWAHGGVDYKSKTNNDNIYAIYPGKVEETGYNSAGGNYIEIKHNYDGKTFYSLYLHLKDNSIRVKKGDEVTGGQHIAIMGDTGSEQTGKHLHLQVTNKSCINSNGSIHTPKNNRKYKSWSEEKQSQKKTFVSWKKITFYNPEILIKEGLSVIG